VEQVIAATACKAALRSRGRGRQPSTWRATSQRLRGRSGPAVRGAARPSAIPASRCVARPGDGARSSRTSTSICARFCAAIARNPTTLRALVSTGIDFNRALRSLRGCRGFLLGGEGLVAADI